MDEKLIELVRKCEELYDMANKKYSFSPWKEILWGQIGEELQKSGNSSNVFYCAFRTDYHCRITEVLIIRKMQSVAVLEYG
jgi:hypothetical protein